MVIIDREYTQQTNLNKAEREIKIVTDILSKQINKLNVLIVGPGNFSIKEEPSSFTSMEFTDTNSSKDTSTYQPFILSSFFEESSLDYTIAILDKDPLVLNLVKNQEEIRIGKGDLNFKRAEGSFNDYIKRCKLKEGEYGFRNDYLDKLGIKIDLNLGINIAFARIPKTFKEKRDSGEINFIEGDVKDVNLSCYSPFDMVLCTRALHCLPTDNDKIEALKNIEKNMKDGAYLIIDDIDIRNLLEKDGSNAEKFGFVNLTKRLEDKEIPLEAYIFQKIGKK